MEIVNYYICFETNEFIVHATYLLIKLKTTIKSNDEIQITMGTCLRKSGTKPSYFSYQFILSTFAIVETTAINCELR